VAAPAWAGGAALAPARGLSPERGQPERGNFFPTSPPPGRMEHKRSALGGGVTFRARGSPTAPPPLVRRAGRG